MGNRQEISFLKAISTLPVVDKDSLLGAVTVYRQLLRTNGVKGDSLRRAVGRVKTMLFDGNPHVVQGTLNIIQSATNGRQANRP